MQGEGGCQGAVGSQHRECCKGCVARLRLSVWLEGHESVCAEAFAALCVCQGWGGQQRCVCRDAAAGSVSIGRETKGGATEWRG